MGADSGSRDDIASRIARLSPEKRALLEKRLVAERPSQRPALLIPRRVSSGPAPLSFAQQRLWFLEQLGPGSSLYNIPDVFRVLGPLDPEALCRSLAEIVRRHGALRTAFLLDDGQASQHVQDADLAVPLIDLSALPEDRRESEARRLAAERVEEPFDLARPPLLRASLLRLSPGEHWLVLSIHHIVADEASYGVLYGELASLYGGFSAGRPIALDLLPLQYADYAVWQREWLAGGVEQKQAAYWKAKLHGDLPIATFPADRPRPAVASYRGADWTIRLPERLLEGLRALSRREGATLFMTLLAAFDVLLAREGGGEDILVGTPITGRTRIETEKLIGFFVNTLVLRTSLSGDPTFRELLGRVRETALEAYENQDLPFERLVEVVRPDRTLSHGPIFQTMFTLDEAGGATLELPGLEVRPVEVATTSAKFDLSLMASAGRDGLALTFEYALDLFDESTVDRIAGHYSRLLEEIVADPSRPVFRLPLLTEAEQRLLLVEWNDTRADYPREKCLHDLFAEQVSRTPEAVAVEVADAPGLSYRDLDRKASQLAQRLQEWGVGPETLVGLCVPRSVEMLVGLLGVLKAGGAYVPIDPTYPADRLAYMLEDSGAKILLTVDGVMDSLPSFTGRIFRLDADWGDVAALAGKPGESGVTAANLAYVMYTSGSTGRPKGVMIPHRGVVNYLTWCVQAYGMKGGTGAPIQSSLSFDLTITGLYGPLLCGKRVLLLPEGFANEALGNLLRQEGGFSLIKITPARLDLLTQQVLPEQAAGRTGSFVIGGEAVRFESLDLWRDSAPQTALWNEYGPTETVVGCCVYRVRPGDPREGPVPIGRPIANTRLYVLDRYRQPVPIGVAGELYIGGEGVGRGYWKRPDLTAERFLPDPFSKDPEARLYRTGDLARYRTDGNLEFLGRSDDQVKIRGFRVELGEVEAAVCQHTMVESAVAALREDLPGDRRLVAYVVPKPGLPWNSESLRLYLRERLPDHMVPSVFVRLEALPLTVNGKLDRKALPAPDWSSRQLERDYEPPRDVLELQLSRIWEAVLGTRPIGLEDDFFDLGGHSLLAVRLFAEIEKATGKKLPLATLFQAPTVSRLAQVLRDRGFSSPWSSLVPIQPRGSHPAFYCVHAAGGGVLHYRDLATRLGPDYPFYGLQARAFVPGGEAHTRIEDMAEAYLAEIRSFQPVGPYFLGGHSAGGTVAYEMACRLVADGEKVALLAFFDTWAPGHGEVIPEKLVRVRLSEIGLKLGNFYGEIRKGVRLAYLREKLAVRVKVLLGRASNVPPELQEVIDTIEQAAESYRPAAVYEGKITLFRAHHQPPEYAFNDTLGWNAFAAGGVEIHEVPGFHGDLVEEPQVSVLAVGLRECLDRAAQPVALKRQEPPD